MKKIIENLQAIIDSIEFVETEHNANYVIGAEDKKLLNEALNEALQQHNVSGQLATTNLCKCRKPWGVAGLCVLCEKPIG